MGIIQKLFEGRLVPDVWCGKSSAIYREAQAEVLELMQGLDRKTADTLMDQITVMERENTQKYFSLGFRWGVQLLLDALYGGDGN